MASGPRATPAAADPRRPLWARRNPLELEDAARRTTAYVYGNILVLAALVSLLNEDVDSGRAFWIVLGTAVSTFLAHAFAEGMGALVRASETLTWANSVKLARESLPVLTSGVIPAGIILLGRLGVLAAGPALTVAEALVLLRIAGTGIVVARLRNERSSLLIILSGIAVALGGALVSVLKVYLTH